MVTRLEVKKAIRKKAHDLIDAGVFYTATGRQEARAEIVKAMHEVLVLAGRDLDALPEEIEGQGDLLKGTPIGWAMVPVQITPAIRAVFIACATGKLKLTIEEAWEAIIEAAAEAAKGA